MSKRVFNILVGIASILMIIAFIATSAEAFIIAIPTLIIDLIFTSALLISFERGDIYEDR